VNAIQRIADVVVQKETPVVAGRVGAYQRVRERFLLSRLLLDDITLLTELADSVEFARAPR
jgi:hypothetical protein